MPSATMGPPWVDGRALIGAAAPNPGYNPAALDQSYWSGTPPAASNYGTNYGYVNYGDGTMPILGPFRQAPTADRRQSR